MQDNGAPKETKVGPGGSITDIRMSLRKNF